MRRLAVTALVALCVIAGCTRFTGGIVGKGDFAWQLSGERQGSASGVAMYELFPSQSLHKGPYMLWLYVGTDTSRTADSTLIIGAPLGLTAGHHDIARYDVRPPHDSDFSLNLGMGKEGRLRADSGSVEITTEGGWVKGEFKAYLSWPEPDRTIGPTVLTGSFKVR